MALDGKIAVETGGPTAETAKLHFSRGNGGARPGAG